MLNSEQDRVLTRSRMQFGRWMLKKGLIEQQELDLALEEQKQQGGQLGQVLYRLDILSDRQVVDALADYLSIDYFPLEDVTKIDIELARIIPESIAERFDLIAVDREDDKIVIAMLDPTDIIAMDTVAIKIKQPVKAVISSPLQIKKAHQLIYRGSYLEEGHLRDLVQTQADNECGSTGGSGIWYHLHGKCTLLLLQGLRFFHR